ncbi:ABC transporter permease [Paenibacillus alba]|uniref:ABC transporter permease n=1 Tax=Paenibacillus alba TaxID=1197127 RepID=A0ABU6G8S7_9BACL|nr:ABC transporter permease [Paenibacillus alba]MEC0230561.1 ABC transporter permease [Paenibacillus alba]
MRAMIAQCKAELLRTFRNKRFFMFSLIMPAIFYFIFSSTVGDNTEVGGVSWKAYYLMSMTVFGVVGACVNTLSIKFAQERTQGWLRMIEITPLPSSAYVLSKIVSHSIINLVTIIFMFLLGGLVKGVELTLLQWVGCGLWIWLGSLPFMALGLLIGTCKTVELTQVVAQIIFMGSSILGGLWFPTQAMPKIMQTIAQYVPTFRYGQGAWNIISGVGLTWSGVLILIGYGVVFVVLSSYILQKQKAA